jgi:hypothetical protein
MKRAVLSRFDTILQSLTGLKHDARTKSLQIIAKHRKSSLEAGANHCKSLIYPRNHRKS